MHVDELDIDVGLVRGLIAAQFPQWADHPLRRVEPLGTDNAIFRLGDDLAVRLARRNGPGMARRQGTGLAAKAGTTAASRHPGPGGAGTTHGVYPWCWDIHTWVDGETVPVEDIDAIQAARELAAFVAALQKVDPAGAPSGRGIPLAKRDEEIRYWLARFGGDPSVAREWERALAAPAWNGPPVHRQSGHQAAARPSPTPPDATCHGKAGAGSAA
jgi:aminoglycoside phosphotransferase (APT) family kinase protein